MQASSIFADRQIDGQTVVDGAAVRCCCCHKTATVQKQQQFKQQQISNSSLQPFAVAVATKQQQLVFPASPALTLLHPSSWAST
jgi:hypothetical protein